MKLFFASLLLSSIAATAGQSVILPKEGLTIVQTYFVPLPEEDLIGTFKSINSVADGQIETLISVAIAASDTIIFWDHWEDGYEDDPANPTQLSTEVWGDGTSLLYPELLRGQSIILENRVSTDPNRTAIKYDGKDRISATLPIAVTRSAYPETPGSLMAGAVEVFTVQSWGTEFTAPASAGTSGTNPFEYATFYVMAGFDETQVTYNGNTTKLQKGENLVLGPLVRGQKVTSNRHIQVDLIAGDIDSKFELRWYA